MASLSSPTSSSALLTTTRRKRKSWLRDSLPFWLIAPTVLILLVVQVYPGLYTIWLSLQTRQPDGWEFIGLRNYARLTEMSLFRESVGHTIVFLIGFVAITMFAGFGVALLLHRKSRFSNLYITLIYIPWVIADIIVGFVWRLLVVPDYGLLSGITHNNYIFPPNGL
jgi:multiple sugar transport system permease protein